MVKLSAEKINATAPYKVMIDGEGENVVFETDYEVHYIVGFETFDLLDGIENFASLVIRNDHPKKQEVVSEFLASIDLLNNKPQ